MMKQVDIAIIGGGPAGMAAAAAAREAGVENILIMEREPRLGGILEQCIHNGFGLHRFKEELTGPEYGERYETMVKELGIPYLVNTMVVDLQVKEGAEGDPQPVKIITAVNQEDGYFQIEARAVILAMGCREKPRGALSTPGTRPSGVFTAGTAQKLMNIEGWLPGRKAVILGSGDIGLIMARRMSLEGARIEAVCEIMPDSGGLTRNIVQCLQDFDIPLKLNTTVTEIHGNDRITGVTISQVDENLKPIPGTEEYIECDTLLLSVGLIPENELSKKAGVVIDTKTRGPVVDENRQTSVPGVFACGNVVRVHELVDYVSEEGETAGRAAAAFLYGGAPDTDASRQTPHREQKKGVKNLSTEGEDIVICTICPMGCRIQVETLPPAAETESERSEGQNFAAGAVQYKTTGNTCKRGEAYAIQEMTAPQRTLTSTIVTEDGTMVPVKTDRPIPREAMARCMVEINNQSFLLPIALGTIIIKDIGGTGADLVATRTFEEDRCR